MENKDFENGRMDRHHHKESPEKPQSSYYMSGWRYEGKLMKEKRLAFREENRISSKPHVLRSLRMVNAVVQSLRKMGHTQIIVNEQVTFDKTKNRFTGCGWIVFTKEARWDRFILPSAVKDLLLEGGNHNGTHNNAATAQEVKS